MFEIDIAMRRGSFARAVRFGTGDGLTVLFGPSGAGKTSILNAVAGLITPAAGRIAVGGRTLFDAAAGIDVPARARGTGYVFQEGRLFPHLRVRANLGYGIPAERGGHAFDATVAFLGIGALLDRWPRSLSGGEAQRVAIGRALLRDPAFLLMDEPLTGLDRDRRDEVMAVIERLRDERGLPILYVTHNAAEVDRLATHRVDIEQATV